MLTTMLSTQPQPQPAAISQSVNPPPAKAFTALHFGIAEPADAKPELSLVPSLPETTSQPASLLKRRAFLNLLPKALLALGVGGQLSFDAWAIQNVQASQANQDRLPTAVAKAREASVRLLWMHPVGDPLDARLVTGGSGFYVGSRHIVTNDHVFQHLLDLYRAQAEDAQDKSNGTLVANRKHNLHIGPDALNTLPVQITRGDGEPEWAILRLVKRSYAADLALLEVVSPTGELPEHIAPLRLANTEPELGERVWTVGSPQGAFANFVTQGIIGSKALPYERHDTDSYSTGSSFWMLGSDAPLTQGNSGGPLLNRHGQVVGVNSAKLDHVDAIIPARVVKDFLDSTADDTPATT
ncbi:MAG: serine protease [Candidatus Melainabacteria bacterium]|nr:serine protease [Candidatus Melainabacteria bacterium]